MAGKEQVLVAGGMTLDTIKTSTRELVKVLGGSGSYAGYAASFFAPTKMLGIVGEDFPEAYRQPFLSRGIDLAGMQVAPGKTFHWTAQYGDDMNHRRTLSIERGVTEAYAPALPDSYRDIGYVLIANDPPEIQLRILDQLRKPKFVIADTIDFWIENEREAVGELLRRIDLIVVNDSEARALTGESNTIQAAKHLLDLGPKRAVVKKGEHGSILVGPDGLHVLPAYPVEKMIDPTGAGDSFIGAFLGYCAQQGDTSTETLREGLIQGTLVASFNLEAFTLERLESLTHEELAARSLEFRRIAGWN
ncbi:MAG: PfkB family carbohydrate kinase [Verrucomicrobium sp.]|nr:PfkB family carbohydrate kinase [Verrucomicrobium sp.]